MQLANPRIKEAHRKWLYTPFILLYVTLGVLFTVQGRAWGIDAWLSLAFLVFVIAINRWLKLGVTGFLLLNIPLLTHNLGAFGLYGTTFFGLGFDKYQHFLSSAVAAYIVFHFLAHKLHVKNHETKKQTVIDDHTTTLVLLVIAVVTLLGLGIELLEFSGYVLFEEGEGILFAGDGDVLTLHGSDGNYVDTMTDFIANTFGAIFGSLLYYLGTYKQRPWTQY